MTTNEPAVRYLPLSPVEAGSFEPFGAVIGPESADSPRLNRAPGNLGFLWLHKPLEFPKQPYVGCLRYYYRATRCEFLQKHPDSTVLLIPLGHEPSVVYVATDDGHGLPNLDTARAFLLTGGKGIVLNRGTWIRYAFPLGAFADFAYVTQRVDPITANTSDDVMRCVLPVAFGLVLDVAFAAPANSELGPGGAVISGPTRNPPLE